jgi:hypothetical protein
MRILLPLLVFVLTVFPILAHAQLTPGFTLYGLQGGNITPICSGEAKDDGDVPTYDSTNECWTYVAPPGMGGGEANTASNLGGGLANYSTKSGIDLRFNSFNVNDFDLVSNLLSIDGANWASQSELEAQDECSEITNCVPSAITSSSTDTLTNKTFDANGTGNSLSNVEIADIASGSKSGSDATLITGTAGTNGNCVEWNADGDIVDSGGVCGGGGGGTPGGADTQIQFNDGGSFGGDAGFTIDEANSLFSIASSHYVYFSQAGTWLGQGVSDQIIFYTADPSFNQPAATLQVIAQPRLFFQSDGTIGWTASATNSSPDMDVGLQRIDGSTIGVFDGATSTKGDFDVDEINLNDDAKGTCDSATAGDIDYEVVSNVGTFYGCRQTAASTYAWTALH